MYWALLSQFPRSFLEPLIGSSKNVADLGEEYIGFWPVMSLRHMWALTTLLLFFFFSSIVQKYHGDKAGIRQDICIQQNSIFLKNPFKKSRCYFGYSFLPLCLQLPICIQIHFCICSCAILTCLLLALCISWAKY